MKLVKLISIIGVVLFSAQLSLAQISIGGYVVPSSQPSVSVQNTSNTACTADAFLCPDGVTYVGRVGPSCNFAACPTATTVSTSCLDFRNNMTVTSNDNAVNGEVTKLQSFLSGSFFRQNPTGYFGPVTFKAVQEFQAANGIISTGFFGPITKAKIRDLTCGTNPSTITPIPPVPTQPVTVNSISPSFAVIGQTVTLIGTGLNVGGDYILFDDFRIEKNTINTVPNQVSFTVPAFLSYTLNCIKAPCPAGAVQEVRPGNVYRIRVVNNLGTSNLAYLNIAETNTNPTEKVSISFVDPQSAKVGESVTIYGYNFFRPETKLIFGGMSIPGTPVYNRAAGNYNSAFRFVVPREILPCFERACVQADQKGTLPGVYSITVQNDLGRDSVSFRVNGDGVVPVQAPQITSLSPNSGLVGTEVVIFGSNINIGSDQIYFGGSLVSRTTSFVDQVNTLRFRVPESITPCGYNDGVVCRASAQLVTPGSYDVVVKNKQGISNAFSFVVTSNTGTGQKPEITALSPSEGLVGSEVAISGAGLSRTTQIYFGGSLVSQSRSVSNGVVSTLWFRVPTDITPCGVGSNGTCRIASQPVTPGSYDVVVTNGSAASNPRSFLVRGPSVMPGTPIISSLAPSLGMVGTRVTLYGTNINTGTEYVLFNGYRIPTDGSKVANQVSFMVPEFLSFYCNPVKPTDPCPAGAALQVLPGIYSVQVANNNGVSGSVSFTVVQSTVVLPSAPVTNSVSPLSGSVGTRVTLFGSNINTGTEYVLFNGYRVEPDGGKIANQVSFTVPEFLSSFCNPVRPTDTCPPGAILQVLPGIYTLQIGNVNGVSGSVSFTVMSAFNALPVITDFSVRDISGTNGDSVSRKLVWTTQNAQYCTASGAWSGNQPVNGEFTIGFMSQPLMYALTCYNSAGASATRSIVVSPGTTITPTASISSIFPSAGPTGQTVTLSGQGLSSSSDFVWFGTLKLTPDRNNKAQNTLIFTVPVTLTPCEDGKNCLAFFAPTPTGNYSVRAELPNGTMTNSVTYTVTSNGSQFVQ